ncbi:hypothetical protein EDD86DRAFT_263055 [Gorgonomyces haynaldii]|nr:hypothetical protein EDD86DRAFT_263055 [Gorgonomyces haynaldii]
MSEFLDLLLEYPDGLSLASIAAELEVDIVQVSQLVNEHMNKIEIRHINGEQIIRRKPLLQTLLPTLEELEKQPGFHQDLFSFKAFLVLVVNPFVQGMFYGLGEGLGRVYVGRWFGIAPSKALLFKK